MLTDAKSLLEVLFVYIIVRLMKLLPASGFDETIPIAVKRDREATIAGTVSQVITNVALFSEQ